MSFAQFSVASEKDQFCRNRMQVFAFQAEEAQISRSAAFFKGTGEERRLHERSTCTLASNLESELQHQFKDPVNAVNQLILRSSCMCCSIFCVCTCIRSM